MRLRQLGIEFDRLVICRNGLGDVTAVRIDDSQFQVCGSVTIAIADSVCVATESMGWPVCRNP